MTTPEVACARVTVTLSLPVLPARSWPTAAMAFSPASSGTLTLKRLDASGVAAMPLTDNATLSPALPLTTTDAASITAPFAGASMCTAGPCVSMVNVVVAEEEWPSASVAVTLSVCALSAEMLVPRVNGCESSVAVTVASDGVTRACGVTARL